MDNPRPPLPDSGAPTRDVSEASDPQDAVAIEVAIRIRPPFRSEATRAGFRTVIHQAADSTERAIFEISPSEFRAFKYHNVYAPDAQQMEVYDTMADPVVESFLEGYNGAVLVYGQTGTGKTYTMGLLDQMNGGRLTENSGIVPRALDHVFTRLQTVSVDYELRLSFLQLYCGDLMDLLAPEAPLGSVSLREHRTRGVHVVGAREVRVHSLFEACRVIDTGLCNRVLAPTLMNTTSSRAHTVLQLSFQVGETVAKLFLIDLAGSERVKTTASRGQRLKEATAINKSLSALGNVISALSKSRTAVDHIPYRNSKLTFLLRDTLGGDALCSLICCVSPASHSAHETFSTLRFANRCMGIHALVTNQFLDGGRSSEELRAECARLRKTVARLQQRLEAQSSQTASCAPSAGPSPSPSPIPPGADVGIQAWFRETVFRLHRIRATLDETIQDQDQQQRDELQRMRIQDPLPPILPDGSSTADLQNLLEPIPFQALPPAPELPHAPSNANPMFALTEITNYLMRSEKTIADLRSDARRATYRQLLHDGDVVAWHLVYQTLLAASGGDGSGVHAQNIDPLHSVFFVRYCTNVIGRWWRRVRFNRLPRHSQRLVLQEVASPKVMQRRMAKEDVKYQSHSPLTEVMPFPTATVTESIARVSSVHSVPPPPPQLERARFSRPRSVASPPIFTRRTSIGSGSDASSVVVGSVVSSSSGFPRRRLRPRTQISISFLGDSDSD